jgi:hypothetical protein
VSDHPIPDADDELARLQQAIEAARRAREQKIYEFERFVRGFRNPSLAGTAPPQRSLRPRAERPRHAPAAPERPLSPRRERHPALRRTPILVALALLVLLAVMAAGWWRGTVVAPVREPAAGPPAPAPAPAVAPPVPTPAAAPAVQADPTPAAAITAELRTLRPVWMRVTVDGQRIIERQLPADQRIPLRAERAIVLRTGDAGAVSLTVNGRDEGRLGANGQVVTRTLTAPPSTVR